LISILKGARLANFQTIFVETVKQDFQYLCELTIPMEHPAILKRENIAYEACKKGHIKESTDQVGKTNQGRYIPLIRWLFRKNQLITNVRC